MEHTEYYQLSLWEQDDRIQMEDFNSDNAKIDAALAACGNCKIVTGSYVGTGQYGSAHKNTLSFEKEPKFVIIGGEYTIFALRPMANGATLDTTGLNQTYGTKLSWNGNSISWYSDSSERRQCNQSGVTYNYMALLN